MTRPAFGIAAIAVLGFGIGLGARSHAPETLLDSVKGVRIVSRISCDGSTNPREETELLSAFSPGGWERSFHLDVFESKYCRRAGDLYLVCVAHEHDRWKQEWSAGSDRPPAGARYWLKSCSAWESKDAARYLLSGWYKEGGPGNKLSWKQASIKQVSASPEVYEFADPNGGTARVEIRRK